MYSRTTRNRARPFKLIAPKSPDPQASVGRDRSLIKYGPTGNLKLGESDLRGVDADSLSAELLREVPVECVEVEPTPAKMLSNRT